MSNLAKQDPRVAFEAALEKSKARFAEIIPQGATVNVDRMITVVKAHLSRNPDLLKCNMKSILRSIQSAAELGLEVGGLHGHAYFVPFRDECTLIVGYKGLIQLLLRTGKVKSVSAHVVHQNDKCRIDLANMEVEHEPCLNGDRGPMIGVYAQIIDKDGERVALDYMTKGDVENVRQGSNGKNAAPWTKHFSEMARKTVVRRMVKYADLLPSEVEEKLTETEREEFDSETGEVIQPTNRASQMLGILAARKTPQPQEPIADAEQTEDEPPADVELVGES